MIKNLLLFLLFFVPPISFAQVTDLPAVNAKGQVEIPASLKKLLAGTPYAHMAPMEREIFSKDVLNLFSEKNTSPSLVRGDFNGDGKMDAVVLFKNKEEAVALSFLSSGDSFKVVEMERYPLNKNKSLQETYLSLLEQKEVSFKGKKIKSKRDLIQEETLGGAVVAFFFNGKSYQRYKGVVP
jgi:hypothetical protein